MAAAAAAAVARQYSPKSYRTWPRTKAAAAKQVISQNCNTAAVMANLFERDATGSGNDSSDEDHGDLGQTSS